MSPHTGEDLGDCLCGETGGALERCISAVREHADDMAAEHRVPAAANSLSPEILDDPAFRDRLADFVEERIAAWFTARPRTVCTAGTRGWRPVLLTVAEALASKTVRREALHVIEPLSASEEAGSRAVGETLVAAFSDPVLRAIFTAAIEEAARRGRSGP
ncbi:MAG: hypothetical protein ABFC89_05925 [Methanospirillum sp.]